MTRLDTRRTRPGSTSTPQLRPTTEAGRVDTEGVTGVPPTSTPPGRSPTTTSNSPSLLTSPQGTRTWLTQTTGTREKSSTKCSQEEKKEDLTKGVAFPFIFQTVAKPDIVTYMSNQFNFPKSNLLAIEVFSHA